MSLIREKATESEAVVKDITKDIQVLDLAKKNLITSMTIMKRLQMFGAYRATLSTYPRLIIYKLVNALTLMEELIGEKKYGEVAQTLSVSLLVYLSPVSAKDRSVLSGYQGNFIVFQIVYYGSTNSSRLETHARNSGSVTNPT